MNYQFGNSFVYNFIFLGGMSIRTLTRVAGVTGTTEARTRGAACEKKTSNKRLYSREESKDEGVTTCSNVPSLCYLFIYVFISDFRQSLVVFVFVCFLFVGICFLHRL